MLTFAQILVTFTIDTFITCLFTIAFTSEWFLLENDQTAPNSKTSKRNLSSQSASESYEYGITILITILSLIFRFYFNCIIASFVEELMKNPKFLVDQDDVQQNLKNKSFIKRWWLWTQRRAYVICRRLLL